MHALMKTVTKLLQDGLNAFIERSRTATLASYIWQMSLQPQQIHHLKTGTNFLLCLYTSHNGRTHQLSTNQNLQPIYSCTEIKRWFNKIISKANSVNALQFET